MAEKGGGSDVRLVLDADGATTHRSISTSSFTTSTFSTSPARSHSNAPGAAAGSDAFSHKTHSQLRLPAYRLDVDGLRALAVIAVVLFHAWPNTFIGGFTGVDVFFVISGFVISGIVFRQYMTGSFSYVDFYSRRVKRIFPALVLVMLVVVALGCYVLFENELRAMAHTLVAGMLFSANLQVLNMEQGYFDPAMTSNPLLHLWSLGVEEQFYFVWPFIALLAIRYRSSGYALLALVAAFSFSLNVHIVATNAKMAFYFPLCRFWQMATGGFLAYMSLPPPRSG